MTVNTPPMLAPGVYLVPAVVQPTNPKKVGNIHVQQDIDALTTFQVPGLTHAHISAEFRNPSGTSTPSVFHVPGFPEVQMGTSGRRHSRSWTTRRRRSTPTTRS